MIYKRKLKMKKKYNDNEFGKLGDRIEQSRRNADLTQYQLSKKLGISQKNISKYENNESVPNALIIRDLARVLEVTADYLLFGQEAVTKDGAIHIKDRQLAQWIQEVDNMDDEIKQSVVSVLKLAVRCNKAKQVLVNSEL
jgi:transcriptional regulator with XRE-family HTH domain